MALPTGGTMRSAICKEPVHGPVRLGPVGLDGDEQANRKHHGGPDKAVCCFPIEHYPAVEAILDRQICAGAFGENFTTQGLTESDICIGDCYEIADVLLEVSQPRQPCPTLGHRWHAQDLPRQMVNLGLSRLVSSCVARRDGGRRHDAAAALAPQPRLDGVTPEQSSVRSSSQPLGVTRRLRPRPPVRVVAQTLQHAAGGG